MTLEMAAQQAQAEIEREEASRKQAQAELDEARRLAEAELEDAKRQAEAELEQAKREAEIERLKLEALTTPEPEPEPEPEIDDSGGKLVPDLPPLQDASSLPPPVVEESNNMARILIAVGLVVVVGLAAVFLL